MNDLLEDSSISDATIQSPLEGDVEMGAQMLWSNSDMELEAFKNQIQEVEKQLNKLSSLLKKLKDSNEESKTITKASAMKGINKQMGIDVDEVGKIARNVKAKLEAINKENLANRRKPGYEKGTVVDRSRMNITNALTKKFKELMTEFQTLGQKIQDEYRKVVERRVFTVTGTRPDEETNDRLIETGDGEQIFQKALEEMQLLCCQIYLDMAVLVEAQGEILDNIESQVTNAVVHVTNAVDRVNVGTDALHPAKKQKKSRKCITLAIICWPRKRHRRYP